MRGASEIAEFILRNYSGKVVEVGAGYLPEVAVLLKSLDIVITDQSDRTLGELQVVGDDIFHPRKEIYREARLVYSLRPPLEVQIAMGVLAREAGADVLIRPLGTEIADLPGFSRRLVNLGQARFYLFKLK